MDTRIVTIDLDTRAYDIFIGSGLVFRVGEFIPQDLEERSVFIVADQNVKNFADIIKDSLLQSGAGRVEIYVLESGEQVKSFSELEKLCHWMLQANVSRSSMMVAVGGGVAGDLVGFCASIVLRGIPFIQVPTTLLSQVDSSVGGKTAINTKFGKNMIGSFYQPSAVIADIDTLKSLPRRELLAGYAEIVKYGLINDAKFFSWLEINGHKVCSLDKSALTYAIETSVRAKAAIVQADEREEIGQRALLNLGHTFGHALETASGYNTRLLHGEAVAIGTCMAFELSVRLGLCPQEDYDRVEKHFSDVGLPTRASFIEPALLTSPQELVNTMKRDKKASNGKMKFVVVSGIGHAYTSEDVKEEIVIDVLTQSLGARSNEKKGKWSSIFSSR